MLEWYSRIRKKSNDTYPTSSILLLVQEIEVQFEENIWIILVYS